MADVRITKLDIEIRSIFQYICKIENISMNEKLKRFMTNEVNDFKKSDNYDKYLTYVSNSSSISTAGGEKVRSK